MVIAFIGRQTRRQSVLTDLVRHTDRKHSTMNFFGGALLDTCIKARQIERRERAFKLLAIERLCKDSADWLPCARAIQTIKKIPSAQLMRLLDASVLSVWLEVTECLLTGRSTWFSENYIAWLEISKEQLVAEQIAYIESTASSLSAASEPLTKLQHNRLPSKFEISDDVSIDVWSKPLLANFSGMETMARLTDATKLEAYAVLLRAALVNINAYNSTIGDEIRILIREVVPCSPAAPNIYPSGTAVFTPSAVYLAHTEDIDIAAELLIHESGHLKFRILDAHTPILTVTDSNTRWNNHHWYSPWRDDPRSLMGIVHAIYVFVEVAYYHLYRVKSNITNHTSRQRLHTLVHQLHQARNNNPIDPLLSEHGRLLFNEIDHSLEILLSELKQLPPFEPTTPLYAERHKQWTTDAISGQQAAEQHYAWYRRNYMELIG